MKNLKCVTQTSSCENCKFKDKLITEEPCMNCRDLDEPVWHDNWEPEGGEEK